MDRSSHHPRTPRPVRPALLVTSAFLLGLGPAGAAAASAGAASSADAPYRVANLQAISRPTPFPQGCPGALFDDTHLAGAEIEPAVTVNPADPRNIVATWQQDLGRAARSDLIGTSRDGGQTWTRTTVPRLTRCTGGTADSASDPWVSAGPDGTTYFTGAAIFLDTDPPTAHNVSSRSRDRGRHWSPVTTVTAEATKRVERAVVTADPKRARHAYVAWFDRDPALTFPLDGTLQFARTTDGAATWSPPVTIDAAPPNGVDLSGKILVRPDGSLLAVFARVEVLEDGSFLNRLLTSHSADLGRTWTPAVQVAAEAIRPFADPETGRALSNQDMSFFSADIGADGTVYVAWDRDTSPTSGTVEFVRSADGGTTWTSPRAAAGINAFAFQPAIAVDAHGTVGLLWYDHRRDRPGDAALTTDVWFAHSRDGGARWTQTHVAGPFDERTAPLGRLGEYQGLAAIGGRGFAAVFTMAAPVAQDGPSDIFFARLGPRG